MSKLNLLRETTAELAAHGLTPASVKWVGSSDGRYACSWERFTEIADFDYDQGYGSQKIAEDLVVVGETYWMERHEYDGAEWWAFKKMPALASNPLPLLTVGIGMWNTVAELDTGEEY